MNLIKINPEQIGKTPFELIGKDWMLITAQNGEKTNTMTASWGGFGVMWNKNVAYIVLRPQRYTKEFIDNSETFSLTFFDEKYKTLEDVVMTYEIVQPDKLSAVLRLSVYEKMLSKMKVNNKPEDN